MELGRRWSSQILVLAFGANLGYHNFEVVILVVSMVIFDMLPAVNGTMGTLQTGLFTTE